MNDVGTEAGRGEGLRDRERREGGGEQGEAEKDTPMWKHFGFI